MKSKKEIIFIQGSLYPYKIGGHEVFNFYLFKELAKSHNVKVLSHFKKPEIIQGKNYIKVPSIKPFSFFFTVFTFFKLFKRSNTKVILTFSKSHWINWWPYPILKKLVGLDYIIIIHGGGLTKWKWKFPFMQLFRNATQIVGISDRICNEYEKRTGIIIKKLLPLVPFEKFEGSTSSVRRKYNIEQNEFLFLIVGSIKGIKNPDTVVDAAILLGKNYLSKHKLKFIFAGDGSMRTELEKAIVKAGIENHFLFLGNVNREFIPELYSISQGYIISSDFEGTPLSLVEAMNNRIPVIGSDSPGINNIIQDGVSGRLFERKNAKHLAEKIQLTLINESYLIDNAHKLMVEHFSHSKMLEEYLTILERND